MSDEPAFLNQILSNSADDACRLVYADWLEEQDDSVSLAKGQFLRLECEMTQGGLKPKRRKTLRKRLAELARPLDTRWLAIVSKLPIENCNVELAFRCPKRWEQLQTLADRRLRYCGTCNEKVYYCESIREARRHAARGRCIAVDCAIPRRSGDLQWPLQLQVVGRPSPQTVERVRRENEERMRLDDVSKERERRKRGEPEPLQRTK